MSNHKLSLVMTDGFTSYVIIKAFKILWVMYDLVVGNYRKIVELLLPNSKIPDGFRDLFYTGS